MIIVMPNEEVKKQEKKQHRSFLHMIDYVYEKLGGYVSDVEVDVTKDYLKTAKKEKIEMMREDKIEVEELKIQRNTLEQKKYSKETRELITEQTQELLELGTKVHEILELIDFKNPDYTDLDPTIAKKVAALINKDVITKNLNSKFYHEYEFIVKNENKIQHGVIDLLIENENELIIIDYKLKNIEDKKYKEQLLGYKNSLQLRSSKIISCYLYSIMDEKLVEV